MQEDNPMDFESFDAIKGHVEDSEGVATLTMRDLRDAHGAKKLGVHVRAGIRSDLARSGLAHYPLDLPENQHELVRVYLSGSPIADRIKAVLDLSDEADAQLRQWVTGDAEETLQHIRELVCE
jgi:hypothetical protein